MSELSDRLPDDYAEQVKKLRDLGLPPDQICFGPVDRTNGGGQSTSYYMEVLPPDADTPAPS